MSGDGPNKSHALNLDDLSRSSEEKSSALKTQRLVSWNVGTYIFSKVYALLPCQTTNTGTESCFCCRCLDSIDQANRGVSGQFQERRRLEESSQLEEIHRMSFVVSSRIQPTG